MSTPPKAGVAAGAALTLMLGLVVAIPLLFAGDEPCTPLDDEVIGVAAPVKGIPAAVGRWRGGQLQNAAAIITAGKKLNVPGRAQAIAVMTAMGESSLTVVDHGDAAGPDSRGLFQQRANGAWGSYADRMNPATSASNFYRALLRVPGWQHLTPTQAAHRTQRNADPNYYTQFWSDAVTVTGAITGHVDASDSYSTMGLDQDCGAAFLTGSGTVAYPVPAGSGYRDQQNWHNAGSRWGSWHTGTDLSVGCGTPVLAATAGKVQVSTSQAWSGRWLVKVSTGPTDLTTWYGHMRSLDVTDGSYVTPGQQIGEVGDLGNSSGCHLHFEVHTKNGSIYGPDNINPTTWLAANVGKQIPIQQVSSGTAGGAFRLATFNILGSNHTSRGGDQHPTWPTGPQRIPGMLTTMASWGVDVAALQEVQPNQSASIGRAGTYAMYPAASRPGDNRLVWRTSTFELVDAATFTIPYFNGQPTNMPVALLRQRATGKTAWFISVHNPAETARFHNQGKWRDIAVARERKAIRELLATGRPVFLMGDLNARREAFCPLAAGNLLRSASGGTGAPVCRMPGRAEIDWIFAAGAAGFSAYSVDKSPQGKQISDHPLVLSQAHIG